MKAPVQCVGPTMEENSPSANLNGQIGQPGGGVNSGVKQNDEVNQRIQYSIPGILHFIQHEWARFEMERSQWDVDRAELQARIAFLQGERKGQEKLKDDLVRRIKMLEYALKQERAKYHKLKYGTDLIQGDMKPPTFEDAGPEVNVDSEAPFSSVSNFTWKQGRQLLRQYLQEIGYTDTIIDVRSNRTRTLLGLNNNEESSGVNGNDSSGSGSNKRVSSEGQGGRRTPAKKPQPRLGGGPSSFPEAMLLETEAAVMANFEFLAQAAAAAANDDVSDDMDDDDDLQEDMDEINEQTICAVSKKSKQGVMIHTDDVDAEAEEVLNELNSLTQSEGATNISQTDSQTYLNSSSIYSSGGMNDDMKRGEGETMDSSLGLGELAQLTVNNEAEAAYDLPSTKESLRKMWTAKYTLRSHFDGVRTLAFHPQEPVLITASEDHTLKLWNLHKTVPAKKSASLDVEPLYTFRGHTGPVLCLCMSPSGEQCYSAATDGSIHCWNLPSVNIDPYDSYESTVLRNKLIGHTDAVWRLVTNPHKQQLLSCSADGTLKVWSPESKTPLVQTYSSEQDGIPTSCDFVRDETDKMVAAFTSGHCVVFDLPTGKPVTRLESLQDLIGNEVGRRQIYRIVCHPLLPVTVTAHEDRHIRFFDNNTGKMIHSMVAHLDAVTSLAVDPNGLYLLSGSHDCSIRLWNLDSKTCVQEITAHRKKFDEAILDVAFHPTRPFIASAGADGIAKVFVYLFAETL
ncbi:striatin-3 isoform X2 [Cimex lectularius]|uniref:Striatin N-terminal domain-containing protein n=1 Tax=Cimex lectularius TaxID=79782 RepID=A0A8I6RTL8_CIMLE|nr:striatin-3 isoform X2 [Cimex lectularius]